MKVMVNGVEKNLVANGKNGIEWTQDLLGNYDALNINQETDEYEMTEEDFEWWSEEIDKLNQIKYIEDELSEEQRDEYEKENFDCGDLESETNARLNYLKSL